MEPLCMHSHRGRWERAKERTDKLIFSKLPDKNNLVSKKLFTNIDINTALDNLISDVD